MGRIEKSIDIQIPLVDCYKQLIQMENYPMFIDPLISVRPKGKPDVWQWIIKGHQGEQWMWDIELTGKKHNNQVISWHTLRDTKPPHSGAITLHSLGPRQTRLNFVVDYTLIPYNGWPTNIEQRVNKMVEDSLQRFKSYAEQSQKATAGMFRRTSKRSDEPLAEQDVVIAPGNFPYDI